MTLAMLLGLVVTIFVWTRVGAGWGLVAGFFLIGGFGWFLLAGIVTNLRPGIHQFIAEWEKRAGEMRPGQPETHPPEGAFQAWRRARRKTGESAGDWMDRNLFDKAKYGGLGPADAARHIVREIRAASSPYFVRGPVHPELSGGPGLLNETQLGPARSARDSLWRSIEPDEDILAEATGFDLSANAALAWLAITEKRLLWAHTAEPGNVQSIPFHRVARVGKPSGGVSFKGIRLVAPDDGDGETNAELGFATDHLLMRRMSEAFEQKLMERLVLLSPALRPDLRRFPGRRHVGGCPSCGSPTCDAVDSVAVFAEGGFPPYLTRFRCDACHAVYYDPPELGGVVDDSSIPFTHPDKLDRTPSWTIPVITWDGRVVEGNKGVWQEIPAPAAGLPTIHGFVIRKSKD